jgi:hypothetical protein
MEIIDALRKKDVVKIDQILQKTESNIGNLKEALVYLKEDKTPRTFEMVMDHVHKSMENHRFHGTDNPSFGTSHDPAYQELEYHFKELVESLIDRFDREYIKILASEKYRFPEMSKKDGSVQVQETHLISKHFSGLIFEKSIEENDMDLFQNFLSKNNFHSGVKTKSFSAACIKGNEKMVNALIRFDLRNRKISTRRRHMIFDLTFDQITDADILDGIEKALNEKHFDLVKKMMKMKSLFRETEFIRPILLNLVEKSNDEATDFLLKRKLGFSEQELDVALNQAIRNDDVKMIKVFLSNDDDHQFDEAISSALYSKVRDNKVEFIKEMFQLGLPLRKPDIMDSFRLAALSNNSTIMDVFLNDSLNRPDYSTVDRMILSRSPHFNLNTVKK